MICKRLSDNKYFNYKFITEDLVSLYNPNSNEYEQILYNRWLNDYIIIDKWKNIEIN